MDPIYLTDGTQPLGLQAQARADGSLKLGSYLISKADWDKLAKYQGHSNSNAKARRGTASDDA